MSSPATSHPPLVTRPDDEVLVRVEGVSKKFCRSLKKSLWYGVCDIAGELLPGRKRQRVAGSELRVAGEEGRVASSELLVTSENQSAASPTRNPPPVTRHSTEGACHPPPATAPAGASGLVTRHQLLATASETPSPLATPAADLNSRDDDLREGEFYAVKNVSFELRRGECLGLIGHNGAGNQAAGQPLGPRQSGDCTGDCRKAARRVRRVGTSESTLPQAARRVRRRGKARINTTLLKMLNGLIKPDAGSITMRGRVGALIALGAGFNSILTTQN